jgi:gamma-glutamyltranspeptidase/glutathione hydrolase
MEPSIRLAGEGFPAFPSLVDAIHRDKERFEREWSASAKIYSPESRPPEVAEIFRNPDWARTFKKVAKAEKKGRRLGRSAGIAAAKDYFYRGPIAETIIEFMQTYKCKDVYGNEHHGLLTLEDFSKYSARIEKPLTVNYRGYDVYKCDTWCQGAVLLQHLNLLEGYDLTSLGHNTTEYLHTYIECAKLAFADREHYYADPDFADVPLDMLLSKDYAEERRALVEPDKASLELRPGRAPPEKLKKSEEGDLWEQDTVHLEAVDGNGNMISATPSGAWTRSSPVVPGLGFPMGTRGQMLHLDPNHVEKLEPEKKPSTTLTPSLVMKDRKPYMVFGTPGGDNQDQWTLQFFLNHIDFGMNIQLSLDQPTIHINHMPGSFWPHDAYPGRVHAEPRIPTETLEELRDRGHEIIVSKPWSHGRCLAIRYNPDTGVMYGGASPRTAEAYAIGW